MDEGTLSLVCKSHPKTPQRQKPQKRANIQQQSVPAKKRAGKTPEESDRIEEACMAEIFVPIGPGC